MDETEGKSEVARVMRQIDLELESAGRLEHGFAITARHDFINVRMQRHGERIVRMIEEGRHVEAQALLNTDDWDGEGEQQETKRCGTREILRCAQHDRFVECHAERSEESSVTYGTSSPGEGPTYERADEKEEDKTRS